MRTQPYVPPPPSNKSLAATRQASPTPSSMKSAAPAPVPTPIQSAPTPAPAARPISFNFHSQVLFQSSRGEPPLQASVLSASMVAVRATRAGLTWVIADLNGKVLVSLDEKRKLDGHEELIAIHQLNERLLLDESVTANIGLLTTILNRIPASARKADVMSILEEELNDARGVLAQLMAG